MIKSHVVYMIKIRLVILSLLFVIISCQSTTINKYNEQPPPSEATLNEQVGISPTVVSIETPIRTPIITPTNPPTIFPISTPQLSPTSLITVENTSTPWPTLTVNEAQNKVMSLLEDNQNPDCLLPCWWGAIPGQTAWQVVEPFVKSFSTHIRVTNIGASLEFPLPETVAVPGFDFNIVYVWNEFKLIEEIDIDPLNISGYDPVTMMALYSVPDEVWLDATDSTPEGVLPFQLIMVYQERGISLRYYVEATINGEAITACFEPGVEVERPELFPAGPRIYLWVPGEYKTIEEISPIPWETYFPLESKTDLTVQSFYDRFMNPDEPPCIDTPAELW